MSEYIIDMSNSSYQSTSGLLCADVSQLHEEIVRCRDCELAAYDGEECTRIDEWDSSLWFPVEPDGFCKWGERKLSNSVAKVANIATTKTNEIR